MPILDQHIELLQLRDRLEALTKENDESEGNSQKLEFLNRISQLMENLPEIQGSALGNKVKGYIQDYSPRQLFLNASFASEKPYLRVAIDMLQRAILERSQIESSESLQQRVDGLLSERFRKSPVVLAGLALLVALLGFAAYGVFEIKGYKVDVKEEMNKAVDRGQHTIDAAVTGAVEDISNVEKKYKETLLNTATENATKYNQELKDFTEGQIAQQRVKLTDFAVDLQNKARPDIQNAIGQTRQDFGALTVRFDSVKAQVDKQDRIIREQASSLAATNKLLEEYKKSPDKTIFDKIAADLRLSRGLLLCILGFIVIAFLLSLVGIIWAQRALRRTKKGQKSG